MGTNVIQFDKENKQIEYKHMARSIEIGKLIIGWVVIEKPWYSSPSAWTYYIYSNEYVSGGFCGGASDLGLKREVVDPDTVEIYNQIANVKWNKEYDLSTRLVEGLNSFGGQSNNIIATINPKDKIPYKLWGQ